MRKLKHEEIKQLFKVTQLEPGSEPKHIPSLIIMQNYFWWSATSFQSQRKAMPNNVQTTA